MIVTTSSREELEDLLESYQRELQILMNKYPDTTCVITVDEDKLSLEITKVSLGIRVN